MKPTLVDTDILSQFLRGNPKVIENAKKYLQSYDAIGFSIITYYEIMNGLLSKDANKQLDKFQEFANLNKVLPLTINAARLAAKIAADLRKKGNTVEHADLLIAEIALDHNMQLATNNSKHFQRIEGLELVNWMEPDSPGSPDSGSILDYVA